MPKVDLYNKEGEKTGQVELTEAIFAVAPNQEVVHQVFNALTANSREPWAHTKDKGDVRGGGIKPWKQKGTGRARHGSNRSPLWVGGGITHGPLNVRNYKQKLNKKVKELAVKMCLTDKLVDNRLVVLENYTEDGKTKTWAILRKKLPGAGRNTLLLTADKVSEKLSLAVRNLAKLKIARAQDVSVVDLLNHPYVILDKIALAGLEKRLNK